MKQSRRHFIRNGSGAALSLIPAVSLVENKVSADHAKSQKKNLATQALSRVISNHLGFLPNGGKNFVIENPPKKYFSVHRVTNKKGNLEFIQVAAGELKFKTGDLGHGWTGNFDEIRDQGFYFIRCGSLQSGILQVYDKLYDYPLKVLYNYFPTQRCGDSLAGYNSPCHLNDAKRIDTGDIVDVTGGWHQSCDCRKWMLGTPYGLLGLLHLSTFNQPRWDDGQIEGELRWGIDYFLKMIRADGGLMDHVVVPLGWDAQRDLYPNDAPLPAFYLTISGLALSADYMKQKDPAYSDTCVQAALKLWNYITNTNVPPGSYNPPVVPPSHDFLYKWFRQQYPGSSLATGDRLYTGLRLYKTTGRSEFLEQSFSDANHLVSLQVASAINENLAGACFWDGPKKEELASCTYYGMLGNIGLCELVEEHGKHKDWDAWKTAVRLIAEQYCAMAERNLWGLIPGYWYLTDPGNGRKAGKVFYKYFYNQDGLSIGVNLDITGRAVFLLRAYKIFKDKRFLDTACRQIDWILGCNPFNTSTVEGIGYNQPVRMISCEFFPPTPQIPGGVMTGIVGDGSDNPSYGGGVAHEYDLPPTAMLMWALAELQTFC